MSLAALRASTRRLPLALRAPRAGPAFRKYSTEVPPSVPKKGGNAALIGGAVGAVLLGAGAYYVFASDSDTARQAGTALKSGAQAAKAAAHFVPSKADYEKVYERVADVLDAAAEKGYDGAWARSFGPGNVKSWDGLLDGMGFKLAVTVCPSRMLRSMPQAHREARAGWSGRGDRSYPPKRPRRRTRMRPSVRLPPWS